MNRIPDGKNQPADAGDTGRRTLRDMLNEQSLFEWLRQIRAGLRLPRTAGEHHFAVQQLRRLWSPVLGLTFPALLLVVVVATPGHDTPAPDFERGRIDLTPTPALPPLDPAAPTPPVTSPPPQPLPEPPVTKATAFGGGGDMGTGMGGDPGLSAGLPTPTCTLDVFRQQDGVALVKSIHKMPINVGWGIGTGDHGDGYKKAGLPGPTGTLIDNAILASLRWLKLNQEPDGSWPQNKTAMTGLAVLTFLAYGEVPVKSAEFGATVQKALEFLLAAQQSDGVFPGNYHHPIATYALCEASMMTPNPNVRAAAERAVAHIIKHQNATGGWDYYGTAPSDRDDTSVMGWSAQALKAARMAGVCADTAALDKAIKLAVRGFRKNASPDGGFGYTGPGRTGLTGTGTLCLQLFGYANASEVSRSLALMDDWSPDWDAPHVPGANPQYYFYYATQARYHAGGERWKSWQTVMWKSYVKNQKIQPKAIADAHGTLQDVGWWTNKDQNKDAGPKPVMDTCLAALQLTTYFRFLSTSDPAAVKPEAPAPVATGAHDPGVPVEIGNL